MQAVQITAFGGPEQLRVTSAPIPRPEPGQMVMRVRAASVNRSDLLLRSGEYHSPPPLPVTPGSEASGTVVEVGADVEGFEVGDRVVSWGSSGFYAEYAVIDAARTVAVPGGVPHEVAAALPVAWLTARYALRELGRVQPGQVVLLTASASGVGTAALQTAVADGASVIGVVGSAEKAEAVRTLGATAVIDRRSQPLAETVLDLTERVGVHLSVDLVGGPTFRDLLSATRPGGRVVAMANVALAETTIDTRDFYPKNLSVLGFQFTNLQKLGWDPRPDLEMLLAEIAAGRYRVPIDSRWSLEDAADAHRRLESGETIGKVVLEVP